MKVKVTATKRIEVRIYETYDEFIKDYRFFMSSGNPCSDEEEFEKRMNMLENELDSYLDTVSIKRSGLKIEFISNKYIG